MIKSLLYQTYNNWELLLVDDGSTDGADGVVIDYSKKDSRIKYFSRKLFSEINGSCISRNIGLKHAKGKYVVFFDSDDLVSPECLYNRVQFMEDHKDLDFSVSAFFRYYGIGIIKGDSISGVDTKENDIKNLIIRNLPFTVVTNIYKRESLYKYGVKWDVKLKSIQDADFNIQCLYKGMTYMYNEKAHIDYYVRMRNNGGSVSNSICKEEHLYSHIYYINKLKKMGVKSNYLLLLVESFFLIFEDNYKMRKKLIGSISGINKYKLLIKNYIFECLSRFIYKKGVLNWLLFPNLVLCNTISANRRKKICLFEYKACESFIFSIEKDMC